MTTVENRGASLSQVTRGNQLRAWYLHHKVSALGSLKQLWLTPLQSLMTWLVIAIALALPAALLIVVSHVKTLGGQWLSDPGITIYLKLSISEPMRVDVGERLQKLSGVASLEYISPQQGLEDLKRYGGFGDALSLLTENPLPSVYVLKALDGREETLTELSKQIDTFPEVDKVQLDLQWVQRIHQIVVTAERVVILLGIFLSLGVLLTIGNTTRLILESRRSEIAVIKLVGGTDAFVRRPLLYTGMWYGLMGGALAWLLLAITSLWLLPTVQVLLASYDSALVLKGPGLVALVQLLLVGGFLGLTGAWLASGRHIKAVDDIQPFDY